MFDKTDLALQLHSKIKHNRQKRISKFGIYIDHHKKHNNEK